MKSKRTPHIFNEYFKIRETRLRNEGTLDIPWARTDIGLSRCDVKGARLWNMYFDQVNPLLYKKCFRISITNYFVSTYV